MIPEKYKVCRLCDWSSGEDDSGLVNCNNAHHTNPEAWHSAEEDGYIVNEDDNCSQWSQMPGSDFIEDEDFE